MHPRLFLLGFAILPLLALVSCNQSSPPKTSGAGKAMEFWDMLRSYPDGHLYSSRLYQAHNEWSNSLGLRNNISWKAMGPKNIGGRTLCLAFHPTESKVLFAGSASGGLWKSETGGKGTKAWERVRTGFPVLGVSTIAINPDRPTEMFIGTGEVYNYRAARPGIDDRFNRGSYGMGILKSEDGGRNWQVSLDWRNTELRGVWRIIYNPLRSSSLWAATTEGIFRSRDSGTHWEQVSNRAMATDIEMHPQDTNVIYVSHGGYQSQETGIYRSTDGGTSFELLDQLPAFYTGKASISLAPSEPDWVYVSIGDDLKSIGLFRSINRGQNWTLANTKDVAKWQGWYAHDVAVHPSKANELIYVGIDTWKSFTGGNALTQKSFWQAWQFGQTKVGEPEGPANYVHADIHAAYYHPHDSKRIFLATDGGIFESEDGGENWTSRNGAYQTQQFYADFANSQLDSNLAMGGLQDNSTVIYTGEDAWTRRIGGDGMTAAIDPFDDGFMYGSLQNLQVLRSVDRGITFRRLIIGRSSNEIRNFNGPFTLAPSNPQQIYAGAQKLYISKDQGLTWTTASPDKDGNNAILKIAVAPDNPDLIYLSTNSPLSKAAPNVFRLDLSESPDWVKMEGLPEQLCTKIVFHPANSDQVYAVFGGYNTPHLFYTSDGGDHWTSLDNNLPDLPAHTLFIDPEFPDRLFLGNDLGVFASFDHGQYWEWISQEVAEAMMVMDLSYSPVNRKLRVATHGLGAFEISLDQELLTNTETPGFKVQTPFPNPTTDRVRLRLEIAEAIKLSVKLVDVNGRILSEHSGTYQSGDLPEISFDMRDWAGGVYWMVVEDEVKTFNKIFTIIKI